LQYTIKRYKLNDRTYLLAIFMVYHFITFCNPSGSSLLPAHGCGGARATIKIKAKQKIFENQKSPLLKR